MKIAIFLSARIKSTRLPGKQLLEIRGKTVTEHIIDRLKHVKNASMIVLCTSTHSDDKALVEIAKRNNIECFRGSEEDKLDRYLKAADKFDVEFAAVVDGDDIFCDPGHIEKSIEAYVKTGADYITTRGLPLGVTSFGVKIEALRKVCKIKIEKDTEVWGGYFADSNMFDCYFLGVKDDVERRPDIRLTLDYEEDFKLIKEIIEALDVRSTYTIRDIVNFLNAHPSLLTINRNAQRKYLDNLKKAAKIRVK